LKSWEAVKFQIVVAAILSKQTQFPVVLKAVKTMKEDPKLCPDGENLDSALAAKMDEMELREMLKFVHYNKQKAKHLIEAAKMIQSTFRGQVPTLQDHLIRLPGIGPMLSKLIRMVSPSKQEFNEESGRTAKQEQG